MHQRSSSRRSWRVHDDVMDKRHGATKVLGSRRVTAGSRSQKNVGGHMRSGKVLDVLVRRRCEKGVHALMLRLGVRLDDNLCH